MLFISPVITVYIICVAFVLGAVFASFLGCMGWRMSRGESVVKGRSHCDTCGHTLSWRDLIPIISFFARKGRCAYCKQPIPVSSLYGELLLAVGFVLTTIRFDLTPELCLMLFFICVLYLISYTDLYAQVIPDGCLIVATAVRLVYFFAAEPLGWRTCFTLLVNGLSISLPMLFLVLLMEKLLHKEVMGGGDIKLLFVMGLYLGWAKNLLALFLACLLAIIVSGVRLKREGKETYLAFGPFLSMGAVLSLLVGDGMIKWYLSLFF